MIKTNKTNIMKLFKKNTVKNIFIYLIVFIFPCSSFGQVGKTDYVSYVNPYIGSGGHGHVFVGANVPFGAVQVGPQNIHKGWDWCSGYHYSDSIIIGFSHTHLSGTGCADLGDILVMPYTGTIRTARGEQNNIEGSCSSYYKHENETVAPGYYSLLMNNGVKAELTATERVAMHRYTFPKNKENHILINLKEGNGDKAYETYLKQTDAYTVEGYRFSKGWSPKHKVFFTLKSNQPMDKMQMFNDDQPAGNGILKGESVKGVVSFVGKAESILLKVGISSVSCANAALNIESELPNWDFDKTRTNSKISWNKALSCIDINTKDERAKKIFYTSLYHTFIAPTLYCDVNGDFRGHNDSVYTKNSWKNYSTFSLWDTYRTLNPLFTIIKPEMVGDLVNSFLGIFDQQGKLPIWPLVGGETECMPGYSAIPIIADAYLKGFTGFDAERALKAALVSSTNPEQKGVPFVMEKGFIPCDKLFEATSIAMEYAVGDWGISQMAKQMKKNAIYTEYQKRGKYYSQYFDKNINYIRPKTDAGTWVIPYDPFRSVHGRGDFCEGTGWQYTFFVPQHPEGLIQLFGGDKVFTTKLDSFFVAKGDMGEAASMDISGLIGQYAHGNEPSHHIAYLYPYAGQQWKTAEMVRHIQDIFYTDATDGIVGNEDCGQMSAWHIMSALGFYQVNPSNGVFVFGSPLFDKVSVALPKGKYFEVIALNNSKKNVYIQSVTLNGKSYNKSFILYKDIMNGGQLKFEMGSKPNKKFGADIINRPVSVVE